MLSVDGVSPFASQKNVKRALPQHPLSDHLTLLQVFTGFRKAPNKRNYCVDYGLNGFALGRAEQTREQLKVLLTREFGIAVTSCGPDNLDVVRKCLTRSCYTHCARRDACGVEDGNNKGKTYRIF